MRAVRKSLRASESALQRRQRRVLVAGLVVVLGHPDRPLAGPFGAGQRRLLARAERGAEREHLTGPETVGLLVLRRQVPDRRSLDDALAGALVLLGDCSKRRHKS